jgi:hypothetical protein
MQFCPVNVTGVNYIKHRSSLKYDTDALPIYLKMAVFWVVAPCRLMRPDDGVNKHL